MLPHWYFDGLQRFLTGNAFPAAVLEPARQMALLLIKTMQSDASLLLEAMSKMDLCWNANEKLQLLDSTRTSTSAGGRSFFHVLGT